MQRTIGTVIICFLLLIGALVATLFTASSPSVIEYVKDNADLVRIIWFFCGLVGYLIFKKTRPEFYENRKWYWWIAVVIAYACLGPLILFTSLLTLIVRKPLILPVKCEQEKI